MKYADCILLALFSTAARWGRTISARRCRRRRLSALRSRLPAAQAASLADLKWFEVFKDEELQDLIRTALAQNYDLRDAVARVEAARANLGITRSNQFPQVGASGDARISRGSRATDRCPCRRRFVPSQNRNWGEASLNLLSFEVDIWGRLRRATEAARANLLSAEENRKAVVTTLVSDVATDYFNLRELDYELDISQRTLATRQRIAAADSVAAGRRSRHAARSSPGRATGEHGGGNHSRAAAADRADGKPDQPAAGANPGPSCADAA